MKDLLCFWNSEGYRSAKKLRADAIKMGFIIRLARQTALTRV